MKMEKECEYCKQTHHNSLEKIENCMNIRVNIVNSNLIMHGYTGKRIKEVPKSSDEVRANINKQLMDR